MKRSIHRVGIICGLLTLMIAGEVSAQGFTPEEGSLWTKLGYGYSRATSDFAGVDDQFYDPTIELGERGDFRSRDGEPVGGTLQIHDVTLDMVWAPVDGFVVGGFVPLVKAVRYENPRPFSTSATGPGDVQLFAGMQMTPRDLRKFGLTAYIKTKIPTSFRYPYTNEALLGEGQVDVSGALGSTLSLLPNLNLNNTIEIRHRFAHDSDEGFADPGDELEASLTLGGAPVKGIWLTVGVSGLWATPFQIKPPGAETKSIRMQRKFYTALLSAYWYGLGTLVDSPGLAMDMWVKAPLAGVDYPVLWSGGLGIAKGF